MILIEENADIKLLRKLEMLRNEEKAPRCIELRYSDMEPQLRPTSAVLTHAVQTAFVESSPLAQLYLLADGDAFLLLDMLQAKSVREFVALLPPGTELCIKTHEYLNAVLVRVQQKLDAAQARIEAERARLQQSKQARKREQILSFAPTEAESERLRTARRKRSGNELMIIEDDAFSRRLLEKILPKNDRVTSVGEPEIALERYALVVPDVLFLDINLPDVSGHELLEKILAIDPSAYIIMISGNSDRENVIRAMSLGARGFIAKPFSRERVVEYLQRCPTIKSELPHAHS